MAMRAGEAKLYLRMYPALRRWLHQCIVCQTEVHRPDMPEQIYPGMAAYNLRRLFRPLALDELQLCADCRSALDQLPGR